MIERSITYRCDRCLAELATTEEDAAEFSRQLRNDLVTGRAKKGFDERHARQVAGMLEQLGLAFFALCYPCALGMIEYLSAGSSETGG